MVAEFCSIHLNLNQEVNVLEAAMWLLTMFADILVTFVVLLLSRYFRLCSIWSMRQSGANMFTQHNSSVLHQRTLQIEIGFFKAVCAPEVM